MCCQDSPDTSGMNRAAEANADVAKQALEWYKTQYYEQAPARKEAADRALLVSDKQLESMDQSMALSKDYADYQAGTFRPLEKQIVSEATNYNSEAESAKRGAALSGDVRQAFASARGIDTRNKTRMGINPSDGAFDSNELSIAEALGTAQALNQGRQQAETLGRALRSDAANLGRGLASQQATSAGVALNSGNSSVNNAGIPLAQAQSATAMGGAGFNTAISGNNSAGQLYGQVAQIQGQPNQLMGALGGIAGQFAGTEKGAGALMAFSDENMKENIVPAGTEDALDAVNKTPVSSWKYKDGMADGGIHVGPMAQDVQRTMGNKAAPGGKQIDLISMNGITMAAIQALTKKVDRLTHQVGA